MVPCDGAELFSEGLQVRHTVEEVQASPHVSAGDDLTDGQLADLSDYYPPHATHVVEPGLGRSQRNAVGTAAERHITSQRGRNDGSYGG